MTCIRRQIIISGTLHQYCANLFHKIYLWFISKTTLTLQIFYVLQLCCFIDISIRIKRVVKLSLARMVFKAWHSVVAESRKTREYFEASQNDIIVKFQFNHI